MTPEFLLGFSVWSVVGLFWLLCFYRYEYPRCKDVQDSVAMTYTAAILWPAIPVIALLMLIIDLIGKLHDLAAKPIKWRKTK